ncbi:geobacillin-26 family protein [Lysinibacillus sp. IITD104]|uniref:geobacillin-26 family protein n=1 Tax=Lysinibacillus sp. IITD104 TaxID=3116650 RepID=UPI002FD1C527
MFKKKLLTSAIAFTTICSTITPLSALANESTPIHTYSSEYVTQSISYENTQYDYQVLQDDEFIRKIRVTTANETSTAEYNKVTGEYTLFDSNGEIYQNQISPSTVQSSNELTITPYGTTITNVYNQVDNIWFSQCKVDRYDYTYPTSTKYVWFISTNNSNGKSVMESTSNNGDLSNFKAAVKTMKTKEVEAAAALAGAYAAAVAALATAAPTLGMSAVIALLGSVGAVGTGAVLLWQAYDAHNDAIFYYGRV